MEIEGRKPEREPIMRGPLAPLRKVIAASRGLGRALKHPLQRTRHSTPEANVAATQIYDDAQPSTSGRETSFPSLPSPPELLNNVLSIFRKQQKALDFVGDECFPPQLVSKGGQLSGACHNLAAVGTRQWGHPALSGFLRVRIYDFAVYMDDKQARQSNVSAQYRGRLLQAMNDEKFYRTLRNSADIDMSLMVRAARNLPIKLLTLEYQRVLRRRLKHVGGSPEDPTLRELLVAFREDNLPPEIKQGGSVRKGTVLTFSKGGNGTVTVKANDMETPLAVVNSPDLSKAIFDMYIGDQPVSRDAKRTTGESFARMVGPGDDPYRPPRHKLVCQSAAGDACSVPLL